MGLAVEKGSKMVKFTIFERFSGAHARLSATNNLVSAPEYLVSGINNLVSAPEYLGCGGNNLGWEADNLACGRR